MKIRKLLPKILLMFGTLAVSLFLIGSFSLSTPKQACAAGGSCCQPNFTFQNGSCVSSDYTNKVNQFCSGTVVTSLTNINSWILIFPFVAPFDTTTIVVDCKVFLTQSAQGTGKSPNDFCYWLLPKIPLLNLTPANPLFNTALPLCTNQFGKSLTDLTLNSVAPPNCPAANQTCDLNTGLCVDNSQTTFIPVKMCRFVPACVNQIDGTDILSCDCNVCFNKPGVFTPFGCIETTPQTFIEDILKLAIGVAGAIAFLMITYGGFTIMTAAGNPERLNGGREIITSAIAGLLLIIFSAVILKIIGVDILKIPGL